MKKILLTLCLFICLFNLSAQYKKASFFTRSGRTFGLGLTSYFMGDGKAIPIGFSISTGKEGEKRFIRWADYTFIPGYKFSYNTTNNKDFGVTEQVTVKGKSKFLLNYDLNFGWYLTDKNNEDRKLNFYSGFGFGILILGGVKQSNEEDFQVLEKVLEETNTSFGVRGGFGFVYKLSERVGLKADAGYNYQFNGGDNKQYSRFYVFTSHPYLSVGIRFSFKNDD